MFVELLPILRNRSVMLTLALVGDKAIRVNVIPKRLKDSDSGDDALTTPLTVTGTPVELDREFAGQLVGFTEAFVKLGSNLAEIEAAHTTAVKAVEAEKKKEIENKRKVSVSKASSTATEAKPGPVMKDGKPVFGTRTVTTETSSLFDSPDTGSTSGESQNGRTTPTAEQPIGQSEAGAAHKSNGEVHGEARLPGLEEDEDVGNQSC
jgi:PRTRC genetic system protein E